MSQQEDPIVKQVRKMVEEAMKAAEEQNREPVKAIGVTFDGAYLAEMFGVYRGGDEAPTPVDTPVPVALLLFRDVDGTPMRPLCVNRDTFKQLLRCFNDMDEDFAKAVLST